MVNLPVGGTTYGLEADVLERSWVVPLVSSLLCKTA